MTFDPSKPVAADHGRPVRILASDINGAFTRIVAAHMGDAGLETVLEHDKHGRSISCGASFNLYNVPERVERTALVSLNNWKGVAVFFEEFPANVRFTFEGDKLVAVELIGDE